MDASTPVALITGANRGIGYAIAEGLAARGFVVVLTARDAEKGRQAAQNLGNAYPGQVHFRQMDVANPMSITLAGKVIAEQFPKLTVLVNNAAIMPAHQPLAELQADTLADTLQVNTVGPLRVVQAFLPLLKAAGLTGEGYARIINLSSQMGQLTYMESGFLAYRVSKTALNALTRVLADELQAFGITVNATCPGWVRTDMGGASAPRSVEEGAETAIWLATEAPTDLTGGFFQNRQPLEW